MRDLRIAETATMPRPELAAFDAGLMKLSEFGKALGHPARIQIVRSLSGRGEVPGMSVVSFLPLSQPACSRHLSVLVKAGILRARSQGSHMYYRLDREVLAAFCQSMSTALHPEKSSGA